MTPERIVVVVPARDEEATIGTCIASIFDAVPAAGLTAGAVDVVVVADSCTDRTAEIARRALGLAGAVLEVGAGNAGTARAIGTDHGIGRAARSDPRRVWTAHTDADTLVPASWLADHCRVAAAGYAALAGVIEVDSFVEHPPHTELRHTRAYCGPTDDHPHVHGANLGFRADAYLAAGGWTAVPNGEDHALWRAVRRAGFRTLATRTVHVVTSGRRKGRARGGFADHLCALGEAV